MDSPSYVPHGYTEAAVELVGTTIYNTQRVAPCDHDELFKDFGIVCPRHLAHAVLDALWAADWRPPAACCREAVDSEGNAHGEHCLYLAGVRDGRAKAAEAIRHAGRGWDRGTDYGQTVHRHAQIAAGEVDGA